MVNELYIHHIVSERDSDTGHSSYYSSEILGVYLDQGEALLNKTDYDNRWKWPQFSQVTPVDISNIAGLNKIFEDAAKYKDLCK